MEYKKLNNQNRDSLEKGSHPELWVPVTHFPFSQRHFVDLSAASVMELMALLLVRATVSILVKTLQDLPAKSQIHQLTVGPALRTLLFWQLLVRLRLCVSINTLLSGYSDINHDSFDQPRENQQQVSPAQVAETKKKILFWFFLINNFHFVTEYVSLIHEEGIPCFKYLYWGHKTINFVFNFGFFFFEELPADCSVLVWGVVIQQQISILAVFGYSCTFLLFFLFSQSGAH